MNLTSRIHQREDSADDTRAISSSILFRLYFAGASIATTIVLTRILGLEQFGRYAWLMSIAFLISGLSQAGANNLIVRETARTRSRRAPVQILIRTSAVSFALLTTLIIATVVFAGKQAGLATILALVLLAAGNLTLVLLGASTRGIGLIRTGQLPELVLRPTLFLALLIFATGAGHSPSAEMILNLQLAAFAVMSIAATWLLLQGLSKRPSGMVEPIETKWIGNYLSLGVVGWLAVGNSQILLILTGSLSNFEQVGLYRVAAQSMLMIGLGLAAIETAQAPSYVRAYQEGSHDVLCQLLQRSCRIGFLMSASAMISLLLLGRFLLSRLFETDLHQAFPALCILGIGQLLNSATGNVGILLIASNRERKVILGSLGALLTTLSAALAFVPKHGAVGAAIAGASGMTIRNMCNTAFCWKEFGILGLPFVTLKRRHSNTSHVQIAEVETTAGSDAGHQ